jgi:adenine-specific DNA-methyltransferase
MPEEFLEEVSGCKSQIKEWQDLGFGQIGKKKDLSGKRLPVDTKHFDEQFKERLLEKLSQQGNFDDLIDGILIKSENWQALNLVRGKYLGKVQTAYIDPPFNTGKDFLFKDKYQDSSWIALMEDRLALGKQFLKDSGSLFLHLDWNANYIGRFLLDEIFGKNNFLNEIVWRIGWLSGYKTVVERFIRNHDTLLFYAATDKNASFFDKDNAWIPYSSFDRDTIKREIQSILQKWNISAKIKNSKVVFKDQSGKVYKLGLQQKDGGYPLEDTWNCSDYEELHSNKIKRNAKEYTPKGAEISQKPEQLLRRIIELTTAKKDLVLDYFLGTGTSTAVAHKLGRRWLGVEMGDYFETDILYRMKHVLAGQSKHEPCGISKEVNWQGGGFFKYHYLEQYEDTLHNIEFPNEGKGQLLLTLFPDEASEYVMRYMLWHETEGSASLLSVKQFESPFEYRLRIISDGKGEKIVHVDLVETFNYLLGLTVGRYRFLNENGRKYIIVLGERRNQRVAVVWRPTKDIDLEKDKEVIDKAIGDFHPDQIFVNGDACIKGYQTIESEFKALMGV